MGLQARRTQNQHLAICKEHPSYSIGWQLIFSSQTSGAGAANGSTLVDATRDSGAADTYNGRYWVRCKSGANAGIWKRVLDDDGAGTLSFEGISDSDGFPNQVANAVDYELWKSPEAVIVVDSSGDASTIVDAVRDEPNDYWEGHWIQPLTGNRRGEIQRCSNFVSSTGTFTLDDAFTGVLAAGDVCVLRRYIDVSNIRNGLTQMFNPRPINRLDGTKPDGSVGAKAGTFGFDARVQGGALVGGSMVQPPLAPAIQACGFTEERSGYGGNTQASCTTTALKVDTASWEYYYISALLSVLGEMAFVTAMTDGGGADDTITISPALGVAPDSGAYIGESWNYRRNRRAEDSDYHACTIEYETDGVRYLMTGCKGNLTISGDGELVFGFDFQVDHWIREVQPSCVDDLSDVYSTRTPVQAHERRCYINGSAVELGGISASLNNEVAPRKVQGQYGINGRAGFGHAGTNPGITARKLLAVVSGEHLPLDEQWFSRDDLDVMIFWGTHLYHGVGLRIPNGKIVQDPRPEDDEGAQVTPYVIEATNPGSYTDPDGTVLQLPDFIISFV